MQPSRLIPANPSRLRTRSRAQVSRRPAVTSQIWCASRRYARGTASGLAERTWTADCSRRVASPPSAVGSLDRSARGGEAVPAIDAAHHRTFEPTSSEAAGPNSRSRSTQAHRQPHGSISDHREDTCGAVPHIWSSATCRGAPEEHLPQNGSTGHLDSRPGRGRHPDRAFRPGQPVGRGRRVGRGHRNHGHKEARPADPRPVGPLRPRGGPSRRPG